MPKEKMPNFYNSIDIFLFPTNRSAESLGLVGLEAMSCGVPVLCSNTTSLAEMASDVGLTCEPTNIEDFAHGIEYLVSNTAQAELMRDAGIRHASQYSWNKTVEQLVTLCEHAID